MKKLFLPLAGLLLGSNAVSLKAAIRLNEVNLNPPNSDLNYEFIELKSTENKVESCAGLTLIIINNDRVDNDDNSPRVLGQITEVWDLSELSTGTNGLLLLGNGYAGSPRGGPWAGFVDPATEVADPPGFGDSDIKSNDGISILLGVGFNGHKDEDVDLNDDGILDRAIFTQIIDSIGFRDRDNGTANPYVPGANLTTGANISKTWEASSLGNRDPDSFARMLGNDTANSAGSWYGAQFPDAAPSNTVTYNTGRFFGPTVGTFPNQSALLGEVTPGRPNLSESLKPTSFRINEVGLNPVGGGEVDRFQYIEIINTGIAGNPTPTARSLQDFWLVLIDSFDGSAEADGDVPLGGGQIIEKWDLSGMTTGSNGLLLIGDSYSSAYNAFQDLVSPQTALGSPVTRDAPIPPAVIPPASTGFSEGDVKFKDGLTLVLVKGFVKPGNEDFDVTDGLGGTDDGLIDQGRTLAQMGTIVDQIGFDQIGKTRVGRSYVDAAANLRPLMPANLVPDCIARKPGNITPSSAAAWYGGSFTDKTGAMNLGFDVEKIASADQFFGGFRGVGSPGLPNPPTTLTQTTSPVQASIRINEVMINPTDINPNANIKDDNREYIELVSSNGGIAYLDGLWVLIVSLEGNTSGVIIDSFPLDGLTTGLNGLVIGGDGYDNPGAYPYLSVDGGLPPTVNFFDPAEGLGGDDFENNGVAVLLIRNPIFGPVLTLSATGLTITGDLDPENDGTLLVPTAYCGELVDSITTSTRNTGPAYAWIDSTPFKADHVARITGNLDANSKEAWQWGQIEQDTAGHVPAMEYTPGAFHGTFRGAASPGRPNHTAPMGPTIIGSVLLNEVNLNPPGADKNFEFVELLDKAGTSRSLNNYSLVMIDNVGPNTGTIRQVWSLDGMSTGSNGLLLIGNRYPLGKADDPDRNNPFFSIMPAETRTGDPAGRDGLVTSFSDGVLGGETDNLNFNLLLVRDFVGHIGLDLDDKVGAGGNVDSPGDGVFDDGAWSVTHDSIMFRDKPVPPDVSTDPPWDGWSYGIADLGETYLKVKYYHPESFARFRGENTPNLASAWYGGDLNGGPTGGKGDSLEYETTIAENPPFPAGFTGKVTPGQPNLSRSTTPDPMGDPDNDGAITMLEQAFGTNPNVADNPLPVIGTVSTGGSTFGSITYRRLKGGTTSPTGVYTGGGFTYTVESSTDLQTWINNGSTVVQEGAPTDVTTAEKATFRLVAPVSAPGGKAWLRLRVAKVP